MQEKDKMDKCLKTININILSFLFINKIKKEELNKKMLGFENTYTIEKQIRDVPRQTVRQEVRVIDGSLFLTHWHTDKEYWSYDQLTENLINAYDFSIPKRELLGEIWENLEGIVLAINTLNIKRGCVDELKVGELLIKSR